MIPGKYKRSGGPKTAKGKQASSQNALTLGAYTKQLILPGEDETQFNELLGSLIKEFAPQGLIEELMVRDIATHIWRKFRYERLESGRFRNEFYKKIHPMDLDRQLESSHIAPDRDESEAIQGFVDERLFYVYLNKNPQRPIEDINRSLFKVIAEFRKSKEWRTRQESVVIEQEDLANKASVREVSASNAQQVTDVEEVVAV